MLPSRTVRFVAVLLAAGSTAAAAAAQPAQGLQPRYLPPPLSNPQGLHFTPGTANGSGLYGPLGYGLGYSPFGYSGLPYGGVGYGALGYGYGYPGSTYGPYSGSYLRVPAVPRIDPGHAPPRPLPPLWYPSFEPVMPDTPLMPPPVPPPGVEPNAPEPAPAANAGAPSATLTVRVPEGASVAFNGTASDQTGTTRVYTTPPIGPGAEMRVSVKVTGVRNPSTVTLRLRAGEKVTLELTR
jgi:uncharacterized protein (TIGR03000 family)